MCLFTLFKKLALRQKKIQTGSPLKNAADSKCDTTWNWQNSSSSFKKKQINLLYAHGYQKSAGKLRDSFALHV